MLLFGRVADRYGPRIILLFGSVCGGATMLLLSQQNAAAVAAVSGLCAAGCVRIERAGLHEDHRHACSPAIAARRWRYSARESIVALGTLPLLTNALNTHLGWRGTYVVYAVIMFALTPVLYLRDARAGAEHSAARVQARSRRGCRCRDAPPVLEGLTPAQIRRDRVFWLIVLTAVLGGGLNVGLTAHIIAAITDKGFLVRCRGRCAFRRTLLGLIGAMSIGLRAGPVPDGKDHVGVRPDLRRWASACSPWPA